uniref:Uncharacterized protein n=1 Tax=Rhizophora mucronata TaxID=61149 RepID=A0A2P2PXY2_RHIMU
MISCVRSGHVCRRCWEILPRKVNACKHW